MVRSAALDAARARWSRSAGRSRATRCWPTPTTPPARRTRRGWRRRSRARLRRRRRRPPRRPRPAEPRPTARTTPKPPRARRKRSSGRSGIRFAWRDEARAIPPRLDVATARAQPVGDQAPDLRARVLLEEVAGVGDHVVDLGAERRGEPLARLRAGAPGLSRPTGRASAARRRAARRAPAGRPPRPGISGEVGSISGNARAPALDSAFGIRRLVGGDHLVAGVVLARAADEEADRQVLGALDEVAERDPRVGHLLVPGEQAGVEDHDPRDPIGVLDREPQPDRAAPVVHDDRRVAQVELLEQRRDRRRRGGRSCTSRCRSACPSGRSRAGPARCSESRRRGPAGSPCATETTTSARRGRTRPGGPSPSSRWARRRPSNSR